MNFELSPPGNAKNDILSGLTVALALVPEAVAFAFVAGVEPLVGLYAAFMVGLITSVIGGRPGMISGATGALAVVMVALVADHGVEYLFATVVLMGILFKIRKLDHSNVPITTINITPTSAAIGICSIRLDANKINANKQIAAVMPDKRPLPPELTLIILCPIMAQPPIPPKNPVAMFATP